MDQSVDPLPTTGSHPRTENIDRAIRACPLFDEMEPAVYAALRDKLELALFQGGEQVVAAGAESDALYIVISGRMRVMRKLADGTQAQLIELGRGQTVGEMGLVTGERRSASVVAMRDSVLARLSKSDFDSLLQQFPEQMTRHFAATVIIRLRRQLFGWERKDKGALSFAVLPLDDAVATRELAGHLQRALARLGRTALLNTELVDAALNVAGIAQSAADHPANVTLTQWLSEQEMLHHYLVYESSRLEDTWTQRILRQTDRILLVADGSRPPSPDLADRLGVVLATRVAGSPAASPRQWLILHHAPSTLLPSGTRDWLDSLAVSSHCHVRRGQDADLARVARLITGQGIGVVLSGGGARGFAHLGAMKALREAGVAVDLVGGSSQGGVMACQLAMGWDDATLREKNHRAVTQYHFDYTFPFTSLMAGGQMSEGMRDMFGETQIEDLWLPCFCTTTDLTHRELVVHTSGPVWKFARATTSLPGVLPPVFEGDRMLVDGGVLNNLPADVMYRLEEVGVVIAFDVGLPEEAVDGQPPYESSLSGWRVLGKRINPFAASLNVPSIAGIMMRVASISNAQAVTQTRKLAHFYGRLDAGDYGMLEFGRLHEIVQNGYRSGERAIAAWRDEAGYAELLKLSGG